MGRPTKLNPDVQARVVGALLVGGSYELAARHGGINPATHYDWCDRGKKALARHRGQLAKVPPRERLYAEYSEKVEGARRAYELELLEIIQTAAKGQEYETTKTVAKPILVDGIPALDVDGNAIVEITTTVTSGVERDWKAAQTKLRWHNPKEYGDQLRIEGQLSADQEATLLSRAIEGVLRELGVEPSEEVGAVVARHLELVVSEAEAQAG